MPIQKWITKMQKNNFKSFIFMKLQFCYRAVVQLCLDTMVCSPKRDERLKCKSASNEGSKRTRRRLFFCKKRTWTSFEWKAKTIQLSFFCCFQVSMSLNVDVLKMSYLKWKEQNIKVMFWCWTFSFILLTKYDAK